MSDEEFYESSLDDALWALEDRGIGNTLFTRTGMRVRSEDLVTLLYASRMVHESATSREEREEIFDAVRRVERELGVKYAFDQHYNK